MPQTDILTPTSDETVARLGEVAALRAMSDSVGRLAGFTSGLADKLDVAVEKLARIHTDVEVLKTQKVDIDALKRTDAEHEVRLKALELARAEDAGGRKSLETLKSWAPTVVALVGVLFYLFKTGALKL